MIRRSPFPAPSLVQLEDAGSDRQQAAMGLPWRSRPHQGWGEPIPPAFFLRDARKVARELLGACLLSSVGAEEVAGVIVEVEAYVGPQDPASHASERVGRTPRNRSMFGAGGNAYVYRSYGVHWCLNAVTGEEGFPAAVLIRGVDPIHGIETARRRREGREPVCAGPGRLCQALGVTGALDGHALREPPLRILEGWRVPDGAVAVSGRVGIRKAAHWPLRFYVLGHPQVSTGPRGLPIQGK